MGQSDEIIATRHLHYIKNDGVKGEMTVCISAPYRLTQDMVHPGFEVGETDAGCDIIFEGVDEHTQKVVGADTIQAVQLAVNSVDRFLRIMRCKYEFFFPHGEPYFLD